jgi:hypothetical protein
MRLVIIAVIAAATGSAEIVNAEFGFDMYTGDRSKQSKLKAVPGRMRVFFNDISFRNQKSFDRELAVMSGNIMSGNGIFVSRAGPIIRKGKNSIRVEFEATDSNVEYNATLAWTFSNYDQSGVSKTDGTDTKTGKGKITITKEFTAPFAEDLPWHHYPSVQTLTETDKQSIAAVLQTLADAFKPNFAPIYARIGSEAAEIRGMGCIENAYAQGVRMRAASLDQLTFDLTGTPEVTVRGKGVRLFVPNDAKFWDKVNNDICLMTMFDSAFASVLHVVKSPAGVWQIVY